MGLSDPLPPAAKSPPPAPRCRHCWCWDVLWDRDHPAAYCLNQWSIGVDFICEKCAISIARSRTGLMGYPTAEKVEEYIRDNVERIKNVAKNAL